MGELQNIRSLVEIFQRCAASRFTALKRNILHSKSQISRDLLVTSLTSFAKFEFKEVTETARRITCW